ncbi:MAG: hypothetical protein A2941_01955 [Candidatus Yanofskybacteria bacterium RIFCSPLOWO2_01_FULL_49_17]|uniref:Uncharacterized protein n=1 Tax=Candidatus Yanofskybacteria bacterium RIFCSPLOWO2_01_FULL_49_17 TaxID=1802700 RepID=A0A1F8GTI3_9BACT|nr:MAG: hypothetical protein A2941_01955 [Candidatus Yanofskybacteria bacterium RIFCSPLOWO2_01_FULL_49_17]
MKRLIHHVNRQPEHIRHLVAIGCTVVVGSLVFAFWFNSFEKMTYALLNPGQELEQEGPVFAVASDSLFGTIGGLFSDLKAQIGELFGNQADTRIEDQGEEEPGQVHPLPVSNER